MQSARTDTEPKFLILDGGVFVNESVSLGFPPEASFDYGPLS